MNKNKLQTKDLINIGIFTAIYFVLFFATSIIGFIPILLILEPVIFPLITGIPFMLYLTKIKKFGMVTIMGTIIGIAIVAMGGTIYSLIGCVLFALLCDLILKSGGYKSVVKSVIGFAVFSLWIFGTLIPIFMMSESYKQKMVESFGQDYLNTLMQFLQPWVFIVLIIGCLVGGVIGGIIGRSMLKKHFIRAGIVS